MKNKALPYGILAVVLALVAGVMTIRWLGSIRPAARQAKVEVKKVNVVVAARPIAKGTRIGGDMVKVKAFEESLAPASAEHALADVTGRITARDISQDDPITGDKLLARGVTAAGLPALVEPGKRAVTVRGSKALGAGGLITPGSRVDVVATFQVPGGGDSKVSRILMEDIPVLTTGTQMETRIGKDGKEELSSTELFTLMVTPGQAEELALAADHWAVAFRLAPGRRRRCFADDGRGFPEIGRRGRRRRAERRFGHGPRWGVGTRVVRLSGRAGLGAPCGRTGGRGLGRGRRSGRCRRQCRPGSRREPVRSRGRSRGWGRGQVVAPGLRADHHLRCLHHMPDVSATVGGGRS